MADNDWESTYDAVFGIDETQEGPNPGTFLHLNIVSHLNDEVIFIFTSKYEPITSIPTVIQKWVLMVTVVIQKWHEGRKMPEGCEFESPNP